MVPEIENKQTSPGAMPEKHPGSRDSRSWGSDGQKRELVEREVFFAEQDYPLPLSPHCKHFWVISMCQASCQTLFMH